MYYRTSIAKEIYFRSCRIGSNDYVREFAINLIAEEAKMMLFLNQLLTLNYSKKFMREVKSRLWLTKQRALMWLAIATDTIEIGKLIPALLRSAKTAKYKRVQDEALELLEIYIKSSSLKTNIIEILEPFERTSNKILSMPFADEWIKDLIENERTENGGNKYGCIIYRLCSATNKTI